MPQELALTRVSKDGPESLALRPSFETLASQAPQDEVGIAGPLLSMSPLVVRSAALPRVSNHDDLTNRKMPYRTVRTEILLRVRGPVQPFVPERSAWDELGHAPSWKVGFGSAFELSSPLKSRQRRDPVFAGRQV
jgi:hypothetical protein